MPKRLQQKINMSAHDAGEIAALDLIQRIFFFGCFALSAALIPVVAQAIQNNKSPWPVVRSIFLLVCGCAIVFLTVLLAVPEQVVTLIFGEAFIAIAPLAWKAGMTAIIFTLTYLIATLGMTLGHYALGYKLLLMGLIQCGVFVFLSRARSRQCGPFI